MAAESSPSRNERSRLTWVPICQVPSVVFASVSADASAAKLSGVNSTAVRQQPEQAIEAPRAASGWVALLRNAGGRR